MYLQPCDECLRTMVCICSHPSSSDRLWCSWAATRIRCATSTARWSVILLVAVYLALRAVGVLATPVMEALATIVILVDGAPLQSTALVMESILVTVLVRAIPFSTLVTNSVASSVLFACLCSVVSSERRDDSGSTPLPKISSARGTLVAGVWYTLVTLGSACKGRGSHDDDGLGIISFLASMLIPAVLIVASELYGDVIASSSDEENGHLRPLKYCRAVIVSWWYRFAVVRTGLLFALKLPSDDAATGEEGSLESTFSAFPQYVGCIAIAVFQVLAHFYLGIPIVFYASCLVSLQIGLIACGREDLFPLNGWHGMRYQWNPECVGRVASFLAAGIVRSCDRFLPNVSMSMSYCCSREYPLIVPLVAWGVVQLAGAIALACSLDGIVLLLIAMGFASWNLCAILSNKHFGTGFVLAMVTSVVLLYALLSVFSLEYSLLARLRMSFECMSMATAALILWLSNPQILASRGEDQPKHRPSAESLRRIPQPRQRGPNRTKGTQPPKRK